MSAVRQSSQKLARFTISVLLSVTLAGCAARPVGRVQSALPSVSVEASPKWENAISSADRERLKGLHTAWLEALADAARGGFRKEIRAEGKLLDPAAGLLSPAPSPGNYLCRLIQIGGVARGHRAFAASKSAFCYVGVDDDGDLWMDKQTGSRQKSGALFADPNPRRLIFVGERREGRKPSRRVVPMDPETAAAGVFERIGPMRYRLSVPRPEGKYKLELLELTPAPIQLDD